MKHSHIEHRPSLLMAGDMIKKQYDKNLKTELCAQIRICRNYLAGARNGYPNQNSWDCGRQDAYGEKIDSMFQNLEILMGAYQLSRGRAAKLKARIDRAFGSEI